MKKLSPCPLRKAETEKPVPNKETQTDDTNITGVGTSESNIQPASASVEPSPQPEESNITSGNATIVTTPAITSGIEVTPGTTSGIEATPGTTSGIEVTPGTRKKRAGVRLIRAKTYSPWIQIINASNKQEKRFHEKDIAKAVTSNGNVVSPVQLHV